MLMAEAGHGGAPGRVENSPPIFGNQPNAFAANCLWRRFTQTPVQQASWAGTHDATFPAATIVLFVAGGKRSGRNSHLAARRPRPSPIQPAPAMIRSTPRKIPRM